MPKQRKKNTFWPQLMCRIHSLVRNLRNLAGHTQQLLFQSRAIIDIDWCVIIACEIEFNCYKFGVCKK